MKDKIMNILVVDDEPVNIEILINYFPENEYKLTCVSNGEDAIRLITSQTENFDIILLDRMLPEMNGIDVLKIVKSDPALKQVPVIMQTARASSKEVAEGIRAGAYYYLTKPFDEDMLMSVIGAAVEEIKQKRIDKKEQKKGYLHYGMVDSCYLRIKTLEEAKNTAFYLSRLYPNPEAVIYGIHETLINAIEHGNLAIGYDLKTTLVNSGDWEKEVNRRLALNANKDKNVEVRYTKNIDNIELCVKDCGNGFLWNDFMEISIHRVTDNHGRGIALANLMCFDSMTYLGNGNEVLCVVKSNTI